MSREKTEEEMKTEFVEHVRALVDYWANQPGSIYDKVEGVAFSILTTIDGESMLPSYALIPLSAEGDKEFYISQGENYYPENIDIGGSLHESFMATRKEDK